MDNIYVTTKQQRSLSVTLSQLTYVNLITIVNTRAQRYNCTLF